MGIKKDFSNHVIDVLKNVFFYLKDFLNDFKKKLKHISMRICLWYTFT